MTRSEAQELLDNFIQFFTGLTSEDLQGSGARAGDILLGPSTVREQAKRLYTAAELYAAEDRTLKEEPEDTPSERIRAAEVLVSNFTPTTLVRRRQELGAQLIPGTPLAHGPGGWYTLDSWHPAIACEDVDQTFLPGQYIVLMSDLCTQNIPMIFESTDLEFKDI